TRSRRWRSRPWPSTRAARPGAATAARRTAADPRLTSGAALVEDRSSHPRWPVAVPVQGDVMENPLTRANREFWSVVNRSRDWWEFPKPLALLNLRALRDELREYNLYDTRGGNGEGAPALGELPKHRTYDGSHQDPTDPEMGMVGSRFGRNAP